MDGESISGLEFLGWGSGATHIALAPSPCSGCNGTGEITEGEFTITCPCRVVVGDG